MRIGSRQSLLTDSVSFIRLTDTAGDKASKLWGTPGLIHFCVLTYLTLLASLEKEIDKVEVKSES